MKFISSILILSIFFISCASNTWIKKIPVHESYIKEINYLGENRQGLITLKDETEIETSNLYLTADSLIYRINSVEKYKSITLHDVINIQFKDHIIGTFYGILGGIGAGTAVGYVMIDWDTDMAGLAMLLYWAIGIVGGGLYGGIKGADINYIFAEDL
jgi:hypothetical protein